MRELADARIHIERHHEWGHASDQDEVFHLNRNQKRPQDGSSGIHDGIGQQDPENRSRASDGPAPWIAPGQEVVRQDDANPRTDSTVEVITKKFAGPPIAFQISAKPPEPEHV